ncbi:hypothetical protein GCM10009809_23270 [Isoptericola hypogeus]|uniref:DUF3592 domain-containing protein n=1 Tax=Isoptericola hypogeus TaxID=300179 RepID=A0ABN2JH30_9MICO
MAVVVVVTAGALVAALALVALQPVWQTSPRWAWQLADLDRNELHLGGVDDIEDGEVVVQDDATVTVRYTRPETDFFGQPTGQVADEVCYLFPLDDPDDFHKVGCP